MILKRAGITMERMNLLAVGSYTGPKSHVPDPRGRGISLLAHHPQTGQFKVLAEYSSVSQPSFLAWDAKHHLLHAVCEDDGGVLATLEITQNHRFRNRGLVPTGPSGGCHLTLNPPADKIYTVSYSDARLTALPLKDGLPQTASGHIIYAGDGPHPSRQESAHAHQVMTHKGRLFISDLGSDTIWTHAPSPRLTAPQVALETPAGSGPRHLAFDPRTPVVYILCELDPILLVAQLNPASGRLRLLETHDVADRTSHGVTPAPAAVKIHPSGETLVTTRRFDNTISVFSIHCKDLRVHLELHGRFSCGGQTPRDASFTPDGTHLLVPNQDSHNLASFAFNPDTGQPLSSAPVGSFSLGSPACILPISF